MKKKGFIGAINLIRSSTFKEAKYKSKINILHLSIKGQKFVCVVGEFINFDILSTLKLHQNFLRMITL